MTPALFLLGIQTAFRLGSAGFEAHREVLRSEQYTLLIPNMGDGFSVEEQESWAIYQIHRRPELWNPGPFADLFPPDAVIPVLREGVKVERVAKAIDFVYALQCEANGFKQPAPPKGSPPIEPSGVVVLRQWVDPVQSRRRWARLGLELIHTGLAVIEAQPNVLPVREKAQTLTAALATNLSALIPDDIVDDNSPLNFGERAAKIFLRASLETSVEHADVIFPKEHMAALAQAILKPLSDEASKDPSRVFPNLDRLETLLRGPMARGAILALNAHADEILTSRFGDDRVAGAVTRSILSQFAVRAEAGADLRGIFADDAAGVVLTAALGVAQKRPELFVHGEGDDVAASRTLLASVAGAMGKAPRPFDFKGGLGVEIAIAALDAAGNYAVTKIGADAGEDPKSQMGVAIAGKLVGDVLAGFKSGLQGKANPFETFFSAGESVEILRLVATHVAKTPGMLVGEKSNPEVLAIASSVARFVAADESGLLAAENWRAVIAVALEQAAANPGALFSIDAAASPEKQIGVKLIETVLASAAKTMNAAPRKRGSILFGPTLVEALRLTLQAAANNCLAILSPERQAAHVAALGVFVGRLQKLSSDDPPTLPMSAAEWLSVYRWFVAHVVAEGPDAQISDDDIRKVVMRAVPARAPAGGAA